jgi:ADP-ribose diphosphatase
MPESGRPQRPPSPWKILHSEVLIDTPYLRLRRDRILTPRGDVVEDYHVRETRGFVVIFALTPEEHVVLVRQYKHGIADEVLELPAGAIDADEPERDAARRELAEETGYGVRDLELVRTFIVDPTNSTGRFSLFLGRGATPTEKQNFDATEEITVELVPLDRILELVRNGTIDVGSHVASIYTVLDKLGRL